MEPVLEDEAPDSPPVDGAREVVLHAPRGTMPALLLRLDDPALLGPDERGRVAGVNGGIAARPGGPPKDPRWERSMVVGDTRSCGVTWAFVARCSNHCRVISCFTRRRSGSMATPFRGCELA